MNMYYTAFLDIIVSPTSVLTKYTSWYKIITGEDFFCMTEHDVVSRYTIMVKVCSSSEGINMYDITWGLTGFRFPYFGIISTLWSRHSWTHPSDTAGIPLLWSCRTCQLRKRCKRTGGRILSCNRKNPSEKKTSRSCLFVTPSLCWFDTYLVHRSCQHYT